MIASLRGTVIERTEDAVVIETGGVGYALTVSGHALEALPAVGSEAGLLCEMLVREDSITLYGFADREERDLFRLLITVNGVGPRVAVGALTAFRPAQLAAAIGAGDARSFTEVPGVGKRTAERIIVELNGKVDAFGAASDPVRSGSGGVNEAHFMAREGLLGLGYDPSEADRMLEAAAGDTPEELIATALRGAAAGDGGG